MNDEIRRLVVLEMERQKLSRYQLAKDIGVEAPNISRLLNGRSGKIPDSWEKIFNRLNLELIVVPKTPPPAPEAEES